MAAETHTRRGSRRVELFVPIKRGGKEIDAIDIAPAKLDHVVRWGDGKIKGSLALMVELCGIDESTLRELTYPDADRVMAAFLGSLPPAIRNDIDNGIRPLAAPPPAPTMPQDDPIPSDADDAGSGFDIGEKR
jgi:hypothetical protein